MPGPNEAGHIFGSKSLARLLVSVRVRSKMVSRTVENEH